MSASAPPMTDQPPAYQASNDSPYPNDPPPKYEPSKYTPQNDNYSSYQNMPQPTNGYQAVVTGPPVLVAIPQNRWGPDPQTVYCPFCNAHITTIVHYEPGVLTWLSSGLLCLFGLWLGCCLLPFCVDSLKDVKHTCSTCNRFIGVYRRLE